jgi:diguanylate cyclase (GGDEF)-like protein
VTASVGVASIVPDDATTPQTLIQAADDALYAAKAAGRNRAVLAGS